MSTVNIIDREISDYPVQLNPVQKKEALSAIKAIAGAHVKEDDFEAEMNRRIAEYETGSLKTYTWEESLTHACEAYKALKAKNELCL
jgi:hypothetical protein